MKIKERIDHHQMLVEIEVSERDRTFLHEEIDARVQAQISLKHHPEAMLDADQLIVTLIAVPDEISDPDFPQFDQQQLIDAGRQALGTQALELRLSNPDDDCARAVAVAVLKKLEIPPQVRA